MVTLGVAHHSVSILSVSRCIVRYLPNPRQYPTGNSFIDNSLNHREVVLEQIKKPLTLDYSAFGRCGHGIPPETADTPTDSQSWLSFPRELPVHIKSSAGWPAIYAPSNTTAVSLRAVECQDYADGYRFRHQACRLSHRKRVFLTISYHLSSNL